MANAKAFYETGTALQGKKIVGGPRVNFKDNPWQVALVFPPRATDDHIHLFCGGSLIAPQWVLPAAHCVDNNVSPASFRVFAGSDDLYGPTKTLEADFIRLHPDWAPKPDYHNDIALVHLKVAQPAANVVGLPDQAVDPDSVTPKRQAWVTGWGAVGEGGIAVEFLRGVNTNVQMFADCNDKVSYNGRVLPRSC